MKRYLLLALAFSGAVWANTSVDDLTLKSVVDTRYNPPTFDVCTGQTTDCHEVATKDEFILVQKPGGHECPAGYYFILNSKEGLVEDVNTATCDPSLKLGFAENERALEISLFNKKIGSLPLDRAK